MEDAEAKHVRVGRSPLFVWGSVLLVIGVCGLGATSYFRDTNAAPRTDSGAQLQVRKCVGLFVTNEKRSVAADAKSLTVIGTVPCIDSVLVWSAQGVYRGFDDGSIEVLAAPMPPCPGGDHYVWLRYPNPAE